MKMESANSNIGPIEEPMGLDGAQADGEIVFFRDLDDRATGEASGSGNVPTTLRMRGTAVQTNVTPVHGRILWPALGFPAVIAPRETPSSSPMREGDATRCITVLVLSNRRFLSKAEAARYLRYVPWAERGRRYIREGDPGSFREEELAVHNDEGQPKFALPVPPACKNDSKHCYGELLAFGANEDGENGIVVSLAHGVREFYRSQGLQFLHEIRVSEEASRRLHYDQYHLFWNNEAEKEDALSDELELLISRFARPRREREPLWKTNGTDLMDEYKYEHGAIRAPYAPTGPHKVARAEVLHPLFIDRKRDSILRIGQITDTHVDVRADVYEENLKHAQSPVRLRYNNWNKSFVRVYEDAKPDSDVILLTGDLIDYGRGHWGVSQRKRLGDDYLYQQDRNWFLFYYLLASGTSYTRPAYTILGNHDWRLNPYTPFAIAGAPSARSLIFDNGPFKPQELDRFLQTAHGRGHERIISYTHEIDSKADLFFKGKYTLGSIGQFFRKAFGGEQTADLPKYPTETNIESVAWYLLTINPFLDYSFKHPRGQKILMLDWAEDENVFFQEITHGRRHGINPVWLFGGDPGGEGPKARNCLTDLQKHLVEKFTEEPGRAKIIGIHAPPIGPWSDWFDDELRAGVKTYGDSETPRGSVGFATRTGSRIEPWKGHPLFAIRPKQVVSSDPVWGMDASYNSFERHRPWFISRVGDQRFGVRLVLSGHIHRNGLFAAYVAGRNRGALAGETLIQSVKTPIENAVQIGVVGVTPPAVAKIPVEQGGGKFRYAAGPLYVNTTSAGPRGHLYAAKGKHTYIDPGYAHLELSTDGTIQNVQFRAVPATRAPAQSLPPVVPRQTAQVVEAIVVDTKGR